MNLLDEIILEASRCINCKTKPCENACPAHNQIPSILNLLKTGQTEQARNLFHETSTLSEICGVLCPHENLCEGHCTLNKLHKPIKIGWIEESLASFVDYPVHTSTLKHKKHLVIGLGPAGISNAIRMAEFGFAVTAIEKEKSLGGAILSHVPSFRYDKERLLRLEETMHKLKINIIYNHTVGKDSLLEQLKTQYDSIFVATGLDLPSKVRMDVSEEINVYYAIDLLNQNHYSFEKLNQLLGHTVGIIGLGNVSVDMARTLIRLGKEVHIIYRRTLLEAPASQKEIMEAVHEGVIIHELFGPVSFKKGDKKKILTCDQTCVITDPITNKKKVTSLSTQSTFLIDDLIFATGQQSSHLAFEHTDIDSSILTNFFMTNDPQVFVGGDLITGENRIVDAMVTGHKVAEYLRDLS